MLDGIKLKELRTKLGLTQYQLGLLFGYSDKGAKQNIHDYESGRRGRKVPPHLEPLVLLLDIHGMDAVKPYLEQRLENTSAEPDHPAVDNA